MDNLAKALINRMAKITETRLTSKHFKILEYAYDYYRKNKVGPLYQNLKKHTGAKKEDIKRLFPHGLNSVYTWVGIPITSTDNTCKPVATVEVEGFREVYLDYNATTPLRKEVIKCLRDFNEDRFSFGNPSSSTNLGKKAYDWNFQARCSIAECLKVKPEEVIFVSGGTEANNMAIKGIAFKNLKKKGHIITGKTEHPSVLGSTKYLQSIGFDVTFLDVNREGIVSPQSVKKHIKKNTILVSIMAANNEIGAVNPIKEIGEICCNAGVPLMVDAVQAFGKIEINPKEMGISLLSISGHKIYAPKGIGALYIDERVSLNPLIHGGKQEFRLRAGTENVGSIMAFGLAAQLIYNEKKKENKRLEKIKEFCLNGLKKIEPKLIVNGSIQHGLPNNLNIGFPDIDSGSLLLSLNKIGVYVSSGSACEAGYNEASHVIRAIGVDTEKYGIIRFGFGLSTTIGDIKYMLRYLPAILKQLQSDQEKAHNKIKEQ